jgi:hypothetical protein
VVDAVLQQDFKVREKDQGHLSEDENEDISVGQTLMVRIQ